MVSFKKEQKKKEYRFLASLKPIYCTDLIEYQYVFIAYLEEQNAHGPKHSSTEGRH